MTKKTVRMKTKLSTFNVLAKGPIELPEENAGKKKNTAFNFGKNVFVAGLSFLPLRITTCYSTTDRQHRRQNYTIRNVVQKRKTTYSYFSTLIPVGACYLRVSCRVCLSLDVTRPIERRSLRPANVLCAI